tara:strand:+ start:1742 stop:2077 length:336 start_codon:yes stop_codon:yes gene_type:complete
MKILVFVSAKAEKEFYKLPPEAISKFKASLGAVQRGSKPFLNIDYLDTVGKGVIELKINGRPAYRCLYVAKYKDRIIVLGAFTKTTNGSDQAIRTTGKTRYKAMIDQFGQP